MMTCKDCLHFNVCGKLIWCERDGSIVCDDFTDRSRYVVREKGEWVLVHVKPGYFKPGGNRPWLCSKCGRVISWKLDNPKENFCPNCGADMRGAVCDACT